MNIYLHLAYLTASVLFIIGIKMLNKTKTARNGNLISALGMLIAILATVSQVETITYVDIFVAFLVGSAIGLFFAYKVKMTQMPEMVALFNGSGGLASFAVALSDYWLHTQQQSIELSNITVISIILSIFIGGITFTGSMVAFLKLNGRISGRAIVFKGQHFLNLILLLVTIILSILIVNFIAEPSYMILLGILSLVIGILVVIPIGGADMPVVISLLNSYSGMAACATGFVLSNNVLIIAGALVGASGIVLTEIMCKAMNRSLLSVLMGGFGQTNVTGKVEAGEIIVKEVGVEEAAQIFDSVSSLIIIPGYGMAVAQAQHAIRELYELCEKKGIEVRFAIHPVAGRMPGHMNVLLAEANIPYDKLVEMELINDDFVNTDLVFVVGANDVVNPAARNTPESPIYGMPVLNADKAKTIIVAKRSMKPGYAGIENELFGADNCLMLFGDARQSITKLVSAIKEL